MKHVTKGNSLDDYTLRFEELHKESGKLRSLDRIRSRFFRPFLSKPVRRSDRVADKVVKK